MYGGFGGHGGRGGGRGGFGMGHRPPPPPPHHHHGGGMFRGGMNGFPRYGGYRNGCCSGCGCLPLVILAGLAFCAVFFGYMF